MPGSASARTRGRRPPGRPGPARPPGPAATGGTAALRLGCRSPQLRSDVQADLGVDDDLLGGWDPVDLESGVERNGALQQRERDRAELVVAGAAADEADAPASGR